jgi:hypothetical protein
MVFVGRSEVFARAGNQCILLCTGVRSLVSYFREKVQHGLKENGCFAENKQRV